jgi:hypothetical protein
MDNSNKIFNSSSGRYVKKTSALGKLILSGKTPPKSKKGPKSCSDSQIRNPKSGRCIKKSGKLARSLNSSPMTSNGSFVPSSSSSQLALPVITGSYVSPPPTTLPKLSASTMFQLQRLDKIQKIKEKNAASKNIQKVFRGYIARKNIPLNFEDAPDFPKPLTTSQTDAILDKKMKDQMKMSKDIEYSKSLFDKNTSLPKSSVDILKVVKNINTNIKNVNKPKIKRTNRRNAMDIDKPVIPVKSENFYKKADRKIKEAMPALIGAAVATGIGLSGRI